MADSDRVAELKRKMQERARQVKAETSTPAAAPASAAPAAPAAAPEAAPVPAAQAAATVVAAPPADAPTPGTADATAAAAAPAAAPPAASPPVAGGAAAPAAPVAPPRVSTNGHTPATPDAAAFLPDEAVEVDPARREMGRREFLTYAWAGALGLVAAAAGFGVFQFMYPRFRAGEFGGEFFVALSSVPATDAAPVPESAGKFWLVQSEEEGPKALYMVCTHLGCLYKWEASTFRFECPCHGSKFSKDGFYIEGPASRSLDRFETRVEGDTLIVDTGAKIIGAPASESPARAVV